VLVIALVGPATVSRSNQKNRVALFPSGPSWAMFVRHLLRASLGTTARAVLGKPK
jgi:hypothetical protein